MAFKERVFTFEEVSSKTLFSTISLHDVMVNKAHNKALNSVMCLLYLYFIAAIVDYFLKTLLLPVKI